MIRWFRSLRMILLILTLVAILPSVGVILYTGYESRGNAEQSAREATLRLVQNLAAVQERLTAATHQMLTTLALLPDVQQLNTAACNDLFRHLIRVNPVYTNVVMTDAAGNIIASALPFDPTSLADRKHFNDAIAAKNFSAGEYIVSRTTFEPAFPFSYPVLDAEGNVRAILIAAVKLNYFQALFRKETMLDGAFMGIVDHAGRRLFRTPRGDDRFPLGQPIAEQVWKQANRETDSGTAIRSNSDGVSRMVAFKRLRLQPGEAPYMYLFVGIPAQTIGAEAQAVTIRNIALVAAAGGLALLFAWAIGRRAIVGKVDILARAATRFGSGDFDTPTGLDPQDGELGHLAAAMDGMADERKKAEKALRQSEARFQLLVEKLPIPISQVSSRGEVLLLNERFRELLGYSTEDIPDLDHWWPSAYPDETYRSAVISIWTEAIARAIGNRTDVEPHEYRVTAKDGRALLLEISGIPLDDGFLATFIDVSDRRKAEDALRESESRLKAIVDNAPMAITLKDLGGRYLLANVKLALRLGLTPSDFIGKTAYDIVNTDWADAIARRDRQVMDAGIAIQNEVETFDLDGTRRTLLVNRFPIFDHQGNLTGIGGISNDISERKVFERGLVDAKLQAELANRAKSEFLANMSHELRTPLNSIIGFAEMMILETFGPLGHERYAEYVGDIRDGAHLLLHIIGDILDLSRIEAGAVILEEAPLDVGDLIEGVSRLLVDRAEGKDIQVTGTAKPDLPKLYADGLRVKQILLNLASNAIKFTPRGGKVSVEARRDPDGGLIFEVTDTGIGMNADEILIALQPFGQVAASQRRDQPGTGLGLPIAKSLAEAHGGRLSIQSDVGIGTRISVWFPEARIRESDVVVSKGKPT